MRAMWRVLGVASVLSLALSGVAVAAESTTQDPAITSPSGQESVEIQKDGDMPRGETSLKPDQEQSQGMDQPKQDSDLNKDQEKTKGPDPLEKQEPGPGPRSADPTGSGKSSGVGAGQ